MENLNFVYWWSIASVQTKQWFYKCYSDSVPSETMIKRRYANFKRGRTDTNDTERSDRLNSAVVQENTKKTPQTRFVRSQNEVAWDSWGVEDISMQCDHHFSWTFSLRKLGSKWMPRLLTVDQNNNLSTIQSIVCNCFNATKRSFCVNMWQWMKHGSTT